MTLLTEIREAKETSAATGQPVELHYMGVILNVHADSRVGDICQIWELKRALSGTGKISY